MPMDIQPTPATWYETDEGEVLTVLAVDRRAGLVDIRYLDGSIEQMDLSSWYALDVKEIESPEDWHGSPDELYARRPSK